MKRFLTREVRVGPIGVGGDNPLRIQSMTTSNTRDVWATVEQIKRLADVGCEIARVTVQGKKEAEACEAIKSSLLQQGYTIPLVADIHFYPPAALLVAEFVDKVRINPGNYLDKRASFQKLVYDDKSYEEEVSKIYEGFSPLVEKCLRLKKAMRIGCNHGSLSDRIMNRYGDTPQGMVQSALEFAEVCRLHGYHDFIFSMKASNPFVMVQAYRLLVQEMQRLGWDYPLHLGVTEAGDGEDGRIKSAMGIGALLLDGLGDTLRVSLTEDPWEEIDPCKKLVAYAQENRCSSPLYFSYEQLSSREVKVVPPLHREASVFAVVTEEEILQESFYEDIGLEFKEGKLTKTLKTVDMMLLEGECHSEKGLQKMISLQKAGVALGGDHSLSAYPIDSLEKVARGSPGFCIKLHENYTHLKMFKPSFILLEVPPFHVGRAREFFAFLAEEKFSYPVVVEVALDGDFDKELIRCSAEIGALLLDNLVQGLCIRGKPSLKERTRLAFNLLQGARKRSIKTEYIACPGCGRTLFGLQEVTKKIREKTGHLPGVKIAVMGCIVNGPGEMADADFGYVGSQSGKIDLYVGKTCVTKGILEEEAPERLIQLIKDKGLWIEPTCISSS